MIAENELLNRLVDSLPAMVAYWDSTQHCRFANRAYEVWFGVSPDALLGKHISELLGPALYRLNLPHIEQALRGHAQEFEREIPDPAGGPSRHSLATYIPDVVDGVVHGFFVHVADVSAIKRAADEKKIFTALLDNSSDFIGIADPNGKPVYINAGGRRMVGLSADYPIEKTQIPDYYPPSERAFAADVIVKAMLERGQWSGETYFRNWKTEEAIPVSDDHFMIRDPESGRVLGMGTITRDITEPRRIAREREESEERFRLTIDEAPIGMALVALDGRFVRVNRALCEILGYTADELMALTFQAITHPDDVAADVAMSMQLARDEIPRYQRSKRYIRKDGTIVDVMLSVSTLRGHDGVPRYFISEMEDITERKRLEEELRLAEAKSSGILSISADAIISVDEDQRITLFNTGAEKIFGYTQAEAIGASLDMLVPERFRAVHREHVARFASGRQHARRMGERHSTIIGLRKGGEEFPADAAISMLDVGGKKVLTVDLRDVTEQNRLEKEQKFLADVGPVLASTLAFEATLTRIAELAVRDLADLCIVEVVLDDEEVRPLKVVARDPSKAWLCDLLTHLPLDRNGPYLVRPVFETRQSLLMERPTEQEVASFAQSEEHLRALRAAEIRSMVAVPLVSNEKLLGAITFISSTPSRVYGAADVRLAEELARRAALSIDNARLYRAAKRAAQARDNVLGVVAHDLRNPLNNIILHANLLRRGIAAEPGHTPAEVIERSAKRMNRLIQDLLDVTRMDAGRLSVEPARVAAREIVASSVDAQKQLAASSTVELRLDVTSELPDVFADRDRLLQVFENLIGNALKFSEPGARIEVGAAPRESEVLFWVKDSGAGIPEEELPHVFERFWQGTKAHRHGAGLGLPIAKGVIEAHGGRIWVESVPGKGASFFFTIPTVHRDASTLDPFK